MGSATDYYFSSSDGNDARSFQQAQNALTPWKTLNKLNDVFPSLKPGDRILFKRGDVFTGGIVVTQSGTAGAPIIMGAYGDGERPIINGCYSISEWTSLGNGRYESVRLPAESSVNMVVINGQNYGMGRFPNPDADNSGYLTIDAKGSNLITDRDLGSTVDWTGGELVLRNQRWILDRTPIRDHQNNTLFYDSEVINYTPSRGKGYFIQNHIETLDRFGEWYFESTDRKLIVYFGEESPDDQEVLVSTEGILVDLRSNHIVLEGLALTGANQYAIYNDRTKPSVENILVKDCHISFSGIDAVHCSPARDIQIENCTIENSNNNGIYLSNGSQNSIIRNNLVQNTHMIAGMGQSGDGNGVAIFNRADGLVAENNRVINTGYSGIEFSGSNSLVKNNFVDHFCMVKDDGGGIYSFIGPLNQTRQNQEVIDNIVLNAIGAPDGTTNPNYRASEGIYLDDNVNNVTVSNNTVAFGANYGIFVHNARSFTVKNNTLFGNRVQFSIISDSNDEIVNEGLVEDNIFFSKDADNLTALYKTVTNDLGDFGVLQNNFYARPFDDDLTIASEILSGTSNFDFRRHTLESWQMAFGQDEGSRKSPIALPRFTIDSLIGDNKFDNGSFDRDLEGADCIGQGSTCTLSWDGENVLDQGALKIQNSTNSRLTLGIGEVDQSKQYLLQFSALAIEQAAIEVSLGQEGVGSRTLISSVNTIDVGPSRKEYELLFSFPSSVNAAVVEFTSDQSNLTYWIDNVQLMEVEANMSDPVDRIRFEYNATNSTRKIDLAASYIDVRGNEYSNSINLEPFESIILLEKAGMVEGEDGVTDTTLTSPREAIKCRVFPNPVKNNLNIEMLIVKPEFFQFELYDRLGRHVRTLDLGLQFEGKKSFFFSTENLVPGLYYLLCRSNEKQKTMSFVKH